MTPTIALAPSRRQPDPVTRLRRGLAIATVAGVLLSLLLPGYTHWFGWTPLWLVLMPASAWWALHRFRMPAPVAAALARRRRPVQARRRRALRPGRRLQVA